MRLLPSKVRHASLQSSGFWYISCSTTGVGTVQTRLVGDFDVPRQIGARCTLCLSAQHSNLPPPCVAGVHSDCFRYGRHARKPLDIYLLTSRSQLCCLAVAASQERRDVYLIRWQHWIYSTMNNLPWSINSCKQETRTKCEISFFTQLPVPKAGHLGYTSLAVVFSPTLCARAQRQRWHEQARLCGRL